MSIRTTPQPRAARAVPHDDPQMAEFAADVIARLTATPKRLSPKYFYDSRGSELFEEITEQPEYYPTRCELEILRTHAVDIAELIPQGAALIEFGSGSSLKTRLVLDAATQLAAYVPVEISGDFLQDQAEVLRAEYPRLAILPVVADFTVPFALPSEVEPMPKVGFFPGSTIGNFDPHDAGAFLRHAGGILGVGASLIIGIDLVKDPAVLQRAYNDEKGVTAAFNRNVLGRINRELGGNLDIDGFEHHAFFNRERSRIEMHLASRSRQRVSVCGEPISFRAGETIHTESSYKYSIESFRALARGSGWVPVSMWTDHDGYFSVHALRFTGQSKTGG